VQSSVSIYVLNVRRTRQRRRTRSVPSFAAFRPFALIEEPRIPFAHQEVDPAMFLKTQIRRYAVEWIQKLAKGKQFTPSDIYNYIKNRFPEECEEAGYTADGAEPKYQKDSRWAIQDCKNRREIRQTSYGYWERI